MHFLNLFETPTVQNMLLDPRNANVSFQGILDVFQKGGQRFRKPKPVKPEIPRKLEPDEIPF